MTTIVITGANRGIGFELAKKYSENSKNTVIATSRSLENAEKLKKLNCDNVHFIKVDINDSLEDLKKSLTVLDSIAPKGVDIVIHNAGICTPRKDGIDLTSDPLEDYQTHFNTNTLGSIKMYQAIYPYWSKKTGASKMIVFISSAAGLTNNYFGLTTYGYGMSKSAINFFAKEASSFHAQSSEEHIKNSVTIAIHPGLVKTDMSKRFIETRNVASLGVQVLASLECAEMLTELFDGLTVEDNGTFKSYDGSTILW